MAVRIVTDSGSDIPEDIARELNITVVPLYVQFGTRTYRDGVDISSDRFFEMIDSGSDAPTTSAASPADFAETYNKLCRDGDSIISIHVSSKVSATCASARQGKEMVQAKNCRIEVVDSSLVTIALGLVAMSAARVASQCQDTQGVLGHINKIIPSLYVLGLLDSLKYIARGGRLGRVVPLLGSVLPVKPLLTIRDGRIVPAGAVRTRSKGIERIYETARSTRNLSEIGIAHSCTGEEISTVMEKLKSLVPDIKLTVSKLGPALGAHGGPGSLLVAFRQEVSAVAEHPGKTLVTRPSLQSLKERLSHHTQKDINPFLYSMKAAQV